MFIFQYQPLYPLQIRSKTVNSVFDWNLSHFYAGPGSKVNITTNKWMPPPPGWIKLNFDGAFSGNKRKASIGGLARDPYGNLLLVYTCEVQASHPLEAELLALQQGLLHLNNLRTSPLLIEGDCLVLLTNIRNSRHLTWDMMPLWRRTLHMLSSFQKWEVQFCKRSAHVVADLLAAYPIPLDAETLTALPLHIQAVFQQEKERARTFTLSFYHPQEGVLITVQQNISVSVTQHHVSGTPADTNREGIETEHIAATSV